MLLLSDVCIQATLALRKRNTDDALYSEDALGFWLSPYRIARRLVEAVVPAARPKLPLTTILQPLVPLSNASNLRYSVYADVTVAQAIRAPQTRSDVLGSWVPWLWLHDVPQGHREPATGLRRYSR